MIKILLLLFYCFISNSLLAQAINTIAGNTIAGYVGDGFAATNASLNQPYGIATDNIGNVYIADRANNRVRKITVSGMIATIAGNGIAAFSGDGGSATTAAINNITGVAIDRKGNVFIADKGNNRIRKVDTFGVISTVAGTGIAGFLGDSSISTVAQLNNPRGVACDAVGNVYIADKEMTGLEK